MKVVEKNNEKIFTKKEKNIIIAEDYNLSKVNYKLIYEREEKSMYNKEVLIEVKKLSQKIEKD